MRRRVTVNLSHDAADWRRQHCGTCPLPRLPTVYFFRLLQSRTNSDIRLHLVAHPVKTVQRILHILRRQLRSYCQCFLHKLLNVFGASSLDYLLLVACPPGDATPGRSDGGGRRTLGHPPRRSAHDELASSEDLERPIYVQTATSRYRPTTVRPSVRRPVFMVCPDDVIQKPTARGKRRGFTGGRQTDGRLSISPSVCSDLSASSPDLRALLLLLLLPFLRRRFMSTAAAVYLH